MVTSLGWVIVWSWIRLIPWKIDELQGEFWRLCCLDANPMYLEEQIEARGQRRVAYVWSTCGTRKHSLSMGSVCVRWIVSIGSQKINQKMRMTSSTSTLLQKFFCLYNTRASRSSEVAAVKDLDKDRKAVWCPGLSYSLCDTWEISAPVSVWLCSEIHFSSFESLSWDHAHQVLAKSFSHTSGAKVVAEFRFDSVRQGIATFQ